MATFDVFKKPPGMCGVYNCLPNPPTEVLDNQNSRFYYSGLKLDHWWEV